METRQGRIKSGWESDKIPALVTGCMQLPPVLQVKELRATSRRHASCWVLTQTACPESTESTIAERICHAPGMLLSPGIDFPFPNVGLTGSTCQSSTIKPEQVVRVQAKRREIDQARCTVIAVYVCAGAASAGPG